MAPAIKNKTINQRIESKLADRILKLKYSQKIPVGDLMEKAIDKIVNSNGTYQKYINIDLSDTTRLCCKVTEEHYKDIKILSIKSGVPLNILINIAFYLMFRKESE